MRRTYPIDYHPSNEYFDLFIPGKIRSVNIKDGTIEMDYRNFAGNHIPKYI